MNISVFLLQIGPNSSIQDVLIVSEEDISSRISKRLTCPQYSVAILAAHCLHRGRGRRGLEISAHFISIRLIRVLFSGELRSSRIDTGEEAPLDNPF